MTGGQVPHEVIVDLSGELDFDAVHAFDEQIGRAIASAGEGGLVVVNMAGVTFCDTSGIGRLLSASHRARAIGCRFVVRNLSARLESAFTIAGVLSVLTDEAD